MIGQSYLLRQRLSRSITCGFLLVAVAAEAEDSDGDGLPDAWETANFHDVANPDADVDFDLDGLTALEEYLHAKPPLGGWSVGSFPVPTALTAWTRSIPAVNRNGQVLVNFWTDVNSVIHRKVYLLNSATGIWTDITPAEPDTLAIGNDLNDAGTVALEIWPSEGYAFSLLRRANGTMVDVLDEWDYPIVVSKINNWEDLIGFNGLPVARVDGNFFYPDPDWWELVNFTDINDQGEVLGNHDIYDDLSGSWTYETFIQTEAGVAFVTGAPEDFPYYALTGEVNWGVRHLNNHGEFAGRSYQPVWPHADRAYLFDGGYKDWSFNGEVVSGDIFGIDDDTRVLLRQDVPVGAMLCSDGLTAPVGSFTSVSASASRGGVFGANGIMAFYDPLDFSSGAQLKIVSPDQDQDEDGMSDDWEMLHGLDKNSASDANADADGDGTTNLQEFAMRRDPQNPLDTSNGEANPDVPDTRAGVDDDHDGMPNAWEWENGLAFNNASDAAGDRDSDGLTNLQEYTAGTDPNNPDTDGDRLADNIDGSPTTVTAVNPTATTLVVWTQRNY
jgi:hypothetical protein